MIFRRRPRPPKLTPEQFMKLRPHRAEGSVEPLPDGGAKVSVKMPVKKMARRLLRLPETVTRTFELDQVGAFVWEQIDGKTSLEQIIARLARRYKLNLREAQASTQQFLKMLMSKGLVVVPVPDEK
jgi:hypothetical protein